MTLGALYVIRPGNAISSATTTRVEVTRGSATERVVTVMGLNYRDRTKLGPLPVWRNVSRSHRGKTVSWTVRAFGVSWNSRTRKKTVDLPGGYSYTSD